ncbi:MAG: hypothetical protein F4Z01_00620 [Gammaproteobacteria bacterium]|nr:hypothetical protein [Gammaproteobacteria bacterium]MYF38997.1 hypothetical protein [Gammaproteobacteria bacterium]
MSQEQTRFIYILYFIGAFIWPVLLAGVILAYLEKRREFDLMLESHLRKQIRIFWFHLVGGIVGAIVVFLSVVILVTFAASAPSTDFDAGVRAIHLSTLFSFVILIFFGLVLVAYVWIASFRGLSRLDDGAPIDKDR